MKIHDSTPSFAEGAKDARGWLARMGAQEDLNFLLTNRIPRIAVTRLMGRIANIESPTFTRLALKLWQLFTPLDLSEAKKQRFTSIKDCFTRELKDGARAFDQRPNVLASPCDAIVGAMGVVQQGQVYQAKGFPYSTAELFGPTQDASAFEGGRFITLRLTSAMYHRFHAPADGTVEHVTYLSGDTWNVNPVALKRVERLFCRNERAVVRMRLAGGQPIALVPVAAVLVASIRLHWLNVLLHIGHRGANEIPCAAPHMKGQEMGWFEHGSTIIVFVPRGFELAEGIATGVRIRAGQALIKIS
jgi:phosphatidylserine decarboxylase